MPSKTDLIDLLRRRESVIADHTWRDRDPADHLNALKTVSEAIASWANAHTNQLDPKLNHFLTNASYAKALAHLESIVETR